MRRLSAAGVTDAADDAAAIVMHTIGTDNRADYILRRPDTLSDAAIQTAFALCARREQGEPLQYLLGSWDFMGHAYAVGEGVLIPRDDTEVVTRATLSLLEGTPAPVIADLCAGSGIIAITLQLAIPDARVTAVEKSADAIPYLRRNAVSLNAPIEILHADLCDCADHFDPQSLDLLISNPPYIRSKEIASLQREIACEPRMALDGGESGYDFYEQIIALYTEKIRPDGIIALELGEGQFDTVSALLTDHGYTEIRGYHDLGGVVRAVTARKQK